MQDKEVNNNLGPSNPYDIPGTLSEGDYAEETKLAIRLAIRAGENMTSHLDQKGTLSGIATESTLGSSVTTKSNQTDFATEIDLVNEAMILGAIRENFPDHIVIGEEDTGTGKVRDLTEEKTWIVDPIDGTTNFASGAPLTCVSIGFCNGGCPVLGVVFSPHTRELYVAVTGKGSFRNGQRIHVSPHTLLTPTTTINTTTKTIVPALPPTKTLSDSVVCFELGYARSPTSIDRMLNAVRNLLLHGCRALRSYGSGVLDLCYVATGRIDVVYTGVDTEGWKPWDYCAATVVVEEAGGVIRTLRDEEGKKEEGEGGGVGGRFNIYASSMVCGVNEGVVEECRKVVLGT